MDAVDFPAAFADVSRSLSEVPSSAACWVAPVDLGMFAASNGLRVEVSWRPLTMPLIKVRKLRQTKPIDARKVSARSVGMGR